MTSDSSLGTIPGSPLALLESLQGQAAHKAMHKMYFAAAELLRQYQGPFAAETRIQREQQALVYEHIGSAAEQERQKHVVSRSPSAAPPGGQAPSAREPALALRQCPSCHSSFATPLVICGRCGLDFRTARPFAGLPAKAAARQTNPGYTKVLGPRRRPSRKHRQESPGALVLGGLGVVIFLIAVMAVTHRLMASITSAGRPPATTGSGR